MQSFWILISALLATLSYALMKLTPQYAFHELFFMRAVFLVIVVFALLLVRRVSLKTTHPFCHRCAQLQHCCDATHSFEHCANACLHISTFCGCYACVGKPLEENACQLGDGRNAAVGLWRCGFDASPIFCRYGLLLSNVRASRGL